MMTMFNRSLDCVSQMPTIIIIITIIIIYIGARTCWPARWYTRSNRNAFACAGPGPPRPPGPESRREWKVTPGSAPRSPDPARTSMASAPSPWIDRWRQSIVHINNDDNDDNNVGDLPDDDDGHDDNQLIDRWRQSMGASNNKIGGRTSP